MHHSSKDRYHYGSFHLHHRVYCTFIDSILFKESEGLILIKQKCVLRVGGCLMEANFFSVFRSTRVHPCWVSL